MSWHLDRRKQELRAVDGGAWWCGRPPRGRHFNLPFLVLEQDAAGDCRLRPRVITWRSRRIIFVVYDSVLYAPLYEKLVDVANKT